MAPRALRLGLVAPPDGELASWVLEVHANRVPVGWYSSISSDSSLAETLET